MTWRGAVAWSAMALAVAVGAWIVAARRTAMRIERAERAERETGAALFHGMLPLTGHLAGHDEPLPTLATRCSNCHEAISMAPRVAAESPVSAAFAASPAFASSAVAAVDRPASGIYARRLGGGWLTEPRLRHGGPPSTYDVASLCALLRTGIDPVSVMIPSAMPRYAATDAHCRALWAYLVASP